MSSLDQAQDYLDILDAYDPGGATDIRQRLRAGIDITDELYEALCVHDELAAEGFLHGTGEAENAAAVHKVQAALERVDPDDGWDPHRREFTDSPRCGLCHEATRADDRAEMYDPRRPQEGSVICHPQCGLDAGMEVA